jgi:CheY-like chemotaxis protein
MTDRNEIREALAHDLKSPLAVIVGFAELLARRDDPKIRTEAAARITEAADRLGEAIDDVLALVARERPQRARADGRRKRIMLVEDDPLVRGLLSATLDEDLYEVIEARDDEDAEAISAREAALVILDWRMPGRAGEDVLAAMKAREARCPVIVLTAETAPLVRAQALDLGADAFLTKPFSPLRLLAVVEELLDRDDR